MPRANQLLKIGDLELLLQTGRSFRTASRDGLSPAASPAAHPTSSALLYLITHSQQRTFLAPQQRPAPTSRPPHSSLKSTLRNRARCGCGFGLAESPRASSEAAFPNPEPPNTAHWSLPGVPPSSPGPGAERGEGRHLRSRAAAGRAALEVRAQRRGSLSGESRLAPPGREPPAMPGLPTRAGPPHPSPPRRPPSRPSLLLSPSAGCGVGVPPLPRAAPWCLREAGVPRGAFPFFLSGL